MNTRNDGNWKRKSTEEDDPPPFMRSWNRIYIAIFVYTCAIIVSLYFITTTLNR